jgi:antitoxin component of MazEF toxin-antitoxin module
MTEASLDYKKSLSMLVPNDWVEEYGLDDGEASMLVVIGAIVDFVDGPEVYLMAGNDTMVINLSYANSKDDALKMVGKCRKATIAAVGSMIDSTMV